MVPLLTCLEKLCNGLMEYFKLNSILDNFLSKLPPNKWLQTKQILEILKSSHPKVFLGKGVLKICSRFTGEHPCRSAISIKLQCNFIEIALRHGWSPVNLLHIFRTPLLKNTSGRLLLNTAEIFYLRKILRDSDSRYL